MPGGRNTAGFYLSINKLKLLRDPLSLRRLDLRIELEAIKATLTPPCDPNAVSLLAGSESQLFSSPPCSTEAVTSMSI